MLDATSTILVIDDDADLRDSLGYLLRSVGLNAKLFASVSDFLKSEPTEGPSCVGRRPAAFHMEHSINRSEAESADCLSIAL
jgi:DNA-binding NtrC family response regulator